MLAVLRTEQQQKKTTNWIKIIITSRINGYIDGYLGERERSHTISIGSSINIFNMNELDSHSMTSI